MSPRTKAAGLVFLAVVSWGFAPVGMRYMVGLDQAAVPALAVIALRYAIATLFYVPVLCVAPRKWSRRDLGLGVLCGLFGILGYNLTNALGIRTVSAGMTGLLVGAEPLFIVMVSALRYRRLPTAWTMLAAAIGLAGIVLLAKGAGPALGDVPGIVLVLVSALAWAIYCVLVTSLIKRRGPVAVTAVTMAAGTLPMICVGAPELPAAAMHLSAVQWEVLVSLALGTTLISQLCWNAGSAILGAEQAGWFLYLLPVVSLTGGALLLGEPVTVVEFFGGGRIMLSVFLSQRAK